MSDFRFPPLLDITAWEAVFAGQDGLPGLLDGGRTHLDFARVEWVDLSVLARALLLIDAVVAAGGGATVTMPARDLLRTESAVIDGVNGADGADDAAGRAAQREMRQRASNRGRALAFMRHAGFQRALATAGWPPETLTVRRVESELSGQPGDKPPTDTGADDHVDLSEGILNTRQRRLLPLRWLRPLGGTGLHESAEFRAVETELQDLGVSTSDAVAICQTILAELIENVARHGGPGPDSAPNALVGAALLGPAAFRARSADALARPDGLVDLVDAGDGRVLRVLVGDSGSGSPTDGATPREPADSARVIGDALESIATADAADRRVDIRGLRRVSRMVHSYRGFVTVRTGDLSASLALSEGEDTVGPLERADVGWLPGTLFEALVLTESRSAALRPTWPAHPAAHRDLRLRLVAGGLEPGLGLTAADQAAVKEAVGQARAAGSETGVVVTLPSAERGGGASAISTQLTLRRALEIVSHGADGVALAAVFPDTNRHLLDLHVIELYKAKIPPARDETGSRAHPIMLFGAHGDPLWYCGHRALRTVLEGLTASDGVLPMDRARELWWSRRGDPSRFEDALRDIRHLVVVEDDSLLLRLSPPTVLRSLRIATAEMLAEEIEHGERGVVRGLFRTPNLAIARAWIDVSRLLEGTVGVGFAAFALARAAETELVRMQSSRPRAVAQAATCPASLVAGLSECLGLRGTYFPMDSELDQDGWSSSLEPPGDADVVLCTDLIGTENTVRRAAAAIARHSTRP